MKRVVWCENIQQTAQACKSACAQAAQRSISIADDVCENRFLFRDHWEMERTHIPVQFGAKESEIDWQHIPADDEEWTYAMNRHTCFVNLGKAWRYTGEERYAEKFARLIEDWIDRVPLTEQSKRTTWRSIEAGLRCEFWLRALALFENSTVLTPALMQKIEACLLVHANYLIETHGVFHRLSNWGVLQDHGLLLLGIYFERSDWCEIALERLDLNLHRSVMRDGTQWEQSPMYHCEVLHCAMDALLHARKHALKIPPRFEHQVHQMCLALAAWLTPDGRLVCQSDTDNTDARDLVVQGAVMFCDGVLRQAAGDCFFEENYWDLGAEALQLYREIEPVRTEFASTALPDSGNYMLRSDFSQEAGYVHFHTGCIGSGHGHADLLHFGAGIGGEDILIDSGRFTYVDNELRYTLKRPSAHNTTLVDGVDFTECNGSWGYDKIALPLKREHCFTQIADSVSGLHLGYLDRGVVTARRVVYLKEINAVVISDRFWTTGNEQHQYEAFFHFAEGVCETHSCQTNFTGERAKGVLLHLDDVCAELIKVPHSRDYNQIENGYAVKASMKAAGSTGMIHVLFMDADTASHTYHAEKQKVYRAASGQALPEYDAQAVRLWKDGKEFTVVLCHTEVISAVDLLKVDDYVGYGKVLVFSPQLTDGICLEW